jgi:flagellar export protein FliJ
MSTRKFHFSLDSVLHVRRHETESARQDLLQTMQARETGEAEVNQARERLAELNSIGFAQGQIGPQSLQRLEAYRREAQCAYVTAVEEMEQLRHLESQARAQLLEKRHAQETLHTLYEQEAQEHRQVQAAAETAFFDEQAVISFNRHNRTAA